MIHVVTEQAWSAPKGKIKSQPLGRPRKIDSKATLEDAELCALALSVAYTHHGFNAEGDNGRGYWWGRDGQDVHRFLVRPATPPK
jgi:hypothetical protein